MAKSQPRKAGRLAPPPRLHHTAQVKEAIGAVARQKPIASTMKAVSPPERREAILSKPVIQPAYQSPSGQGKESKEVKASIESIASREPPGPAQTGALEDAAAAAPAPPPGNLEAVAAEILAAYQPPQQQRLGDEPLAAYRSLSSNPLAGDEARRASMGLRDENAGSLFAYANKDVYLSSKANAQGQKLGLFGTEELSLMGRIQKMYAMR